MNKTVFIDFDGTFADHGRIPAAHLEAVRLARAAGHRVFLCTGRPKVMVPRRVRDGVFDDLVCAAGGYVEVDGQVLSDVRFPAELGARAATVLVEARASFLLEAPEAVFSSAESAQQVRAIFASASWPGEPDDSDDLLVALRPTDRLDECSFSKVSVFDSPIPVTTLAERIGPEVGALPNSVTGLSGHAGELYQLGVDKSVGIAAVEARLGLRREDIVAIGDGHNDLEMLAYAGVGVAVEEAPPEVRAVAQVIIPGPGRGGLLPGFAELGLT